MISWLIKNEFAHNIRSASRLIEASEAVVWDALDSAIEGRVHAVTARKLAPFVNSSLPASLVEGKAIRYPLVVPDLT